jgi:pyruvate formate lyase activating enzyme
MNHEPATTEPWQEAGVMKKAQFWEPLDQNRVHCNLCRFHCRIAPGRRGICGVRENRDGTLYTLVYGLSIAEHVDPIEKKPLFHFLPGTRSLSVATAGCNFHCLHCQNYQISQLSREGGGEIPGQPRSPEQIVSRALDAGCRSIAYTYTEPTIFFEYAYDTAVLAREAGLKNVFVSNGYITTEALEKIAPYLDAANIDLKAFSDKFYREVTGASLAAVLECLRDYRRLGIWLEVTTLLIPEHNDTPDELQAMASFIVDELGADTPWHVTAFYPTYRMNDVPPTPPKTLLRARRIGQEAGLHYVYTGNVADVEGESTFCPQCGALVIERRGFRLGTCRLDHGKCRECGARIVGVGLD